MVTEQSASRSCAGHVHWLVTRPIKRVTGERSSTAGSVSTLPGPAQGGLAPFLLGRHQPPVCFRPLALASLPISTHSCALCLCTPAGRGCSGSLPRSGLWRPGDSVALHQDRRGATAGQSLFGIHLPARGGGRC